MTVVEVWGRIQSQDVTPVAVSGDVWMFSLPSGATGDIYAEFWAKDDAGNTTYRAAILTIQRGTIKCIRWLNDHSCISMRMERPSVTMEVPPSCVTMSDRPEVVCSTGRPLCVMEAHVCPLMEV